MYFITDWTKRVDFDKMRRERVVRLRQKMAEHDLDAVLALKYENCRYASGLRPLWFPLAMLRSAAVVTRESDEIIVFVTAGDWDHRHQTMTWLEPENVRPLVNFQLEEPETKPEEPRKEKKKGSSMMAGMGGRKNSLHTSA